MTTVGVVMFVAGFLVMGLMFAGMFLLTPRGTVAVTAEGSNGQGAELSPTTAPALAPKVPATSAR